MKKILITLTLIGVLFGGVKLYEKLTWKESPLKLYWFIPDGVRNEPYLFDMYKWAREGKLPNIKKLIEKGSYGYSYPNFPSHTPTNFATLLTGAYPEVHGVNDGPMHVIGKPLDKVAIGGFRSVAKKVSPIWKTLEDVGMKVAVLSVPGSTPPEINKGVVVRGRWGGWGADFNAINFESKGNLIQRIKQGRAARWFFFGPALTQYIDATEPKGWEKDEAQSKELQLSNYGATIYGRMKGQTKGKSVEFDSVDISLDKKTVIATLKQGQWSEWFPITLTWKVEDKQVPVDTSARVALIKMDKDGFFRLRVLYDNLNKHIAFPGEAGERMSKALGPMVDFPDNFPAQLTQYKEDKQIFMDEASMSFDWHTGAVKALVDLFTPNVIIHDIYTPNQMLTSKWWMAYVDPQSSTYKNASQSEKDLAWKEVGDMYKRLDTMIGEIMKNSGDNTYIVFSSDHGAVPLNTYVNLNNIFASKGWLSFTIDPATGEPIIDWARSKVIYLKMAHVYVNPNGLADQYNRASGEEYEKLRNEVIQTLKDVKDENGNKVIVEVQKWETVKEYLKLDPDRAGDLVVANAPGYGFNEEMTADLKTFSAPPVSGYKQAIMAQEVPGMWTPFIIAGPGVKKNNFLGNTPFPLVNQYPTIMKALQQKIPSFVQGKSLDIFER